jgi:hypothetical protein
MIDITLSRFSQIIFNPNKEKIIQIIDNDPQILSVKRGDELEAEQEPDVYASVVLRLISNFDETTFIDNLMFDGDSVEKKSRLIHLYRQLRPLLVIN